jgi:cytochrome c-type biogenesis protein
MNSLLADAGMAIWLGILTSVSPCPLATNIAAISFVGRRVGQTRHVLLAGLLFTLGRSAAYIAVALLVIGGLLSIPKVSNFLQDNLGLVLGPLLLATGVILLDIIKFSLGSGRLVSGLQGRVEKLGLPGALMLGIIFALTFCPVSAALFFGGLIPIALKHQSQIAMPLLYGVGTALPVIAFALLLAFSARLVGVLFNKITIIEVWARRVTGIVFILAGLYLIITNNLGIYLGF